MVVGTVAGTSEGCWNVERLLERLLERLPERLPDVVERLLRRLLEWLWNGWGTEMVKWLWGMFNSHSPTLVRCRSPSKKSSPSAPSPPTAVQGPTLVHFSAQFKRFLWERDVIRGCLEGVEVCREYSGVFRVDFEVSKMTHVELKCGQEKAPTAVLFKNRDWGMPDTKALQKIHVFVLHLKSNDQNPTVNPPFKPPGEPN